MRIVTRSAQQPLKLPPQDTAVWLCRCGLSSDGIFCDGSHTSTMGEEADTLHIYQGPTLERGAASIAIQHDEAAVIIDSGPGWHISCFTHDDRRFDEVIALRQERGYTNLLDRYDLNARHYSLYISGTVVVALRVQYCKDRPLDCEEYYPSALTTGPTSAHVGSASRLLKRRDKAVGHKEVRQLIHSVWQHGISNGIYCDLINTTERMIPYYQRMGYRVLPQSDFIHPRLGTESRVMIFSPFLLAENEVPDYIGPQDLKSSDCLLQSIRQVLPD